MMDHIAKAIVSLAMTICSLDEDNFISQVDTPRIIGTWHLAHGA
jgi:hypothetical protein